MRVVATTCPSCGQGPTFPAAECWRPSAGAAALSPCPGHGQRAVHRAQRTTRRGERRGCHNDVVGAGCRARVTRAGEGHLETFGVFGTHEVWYEDMSGPDRHAVRGAEAGPRSEVAQSYVGAGPGLGGRL